MYVCTCKGNKNTTVFEKHVKKNEEHLILENFDVEDDEILAYNKVDKEKKDDIYNSEVADAVENDDVKVADTEA